MVTHALLTSKLDYCKWLYVGLPLKGFQKLQLVQNSSMGSSWWQLLAGKASQEPSGRACWLVRPRRRAFSAMRADLSFPPL